MNSQNLLNHVREDIALSETVLPPMDVDVGICRIGDGGFDKARARVKHEFQGHINGEPNSSASQMGDSRHGC